MIGGRLCVTCYNRERELLSGRNARGNAPTQLARTRPLRIFEFSFTINGRLRRGRFDRVVSTAEVVLQALRTTRGQVSFGWKGSSAALAQGRPF